MVLLGAEEWTSQPTTSEQGHEEDDLSLLHHLTLKKGRGGEELDEGKVERMKSRKGVGRRVEEKQEME